jgi:hypothetical protein
MYVIPNVSRSVKDSPSDKDRLVKQPLPSVTLGLVRVYDKESGGRKNHVPDEANDRVQMTRQKQHVVRLQTIQFLTKNIG